MSLGLQAFFAVLPIVFAGILLVGLRISAKKAMPLVYMDYFWSYFTFKYFKTFRCNYCN